MKLNPCRTIQWLLRLLLALTALGSIPLLAEPVVWNGSTDGDWNNGDNWDGGTPPGDADLAIFYATGAGNLSPSLSADSTVDGLEFNANATDPVTITLDATHPLRLDGGAPVDILVATGSQVIDGAGGVSGDPPEMIIFGGDQVWQIAENATLTINARLNPAPWPNNNTVHRKQGQGKLVLGGYNGGTGGWNFTGYGGLFRIEQGVLELTDSAACGNSNNPYTVLAGATMKWTESHASYVCRAGLLRLNGDGVNGGGALLIDRPGEATNFHDGSSSLSLDTDAAIGVTAGSTLVISQNITGTGLGSSLDKVGAGELILASADNTYGGYGSNERTRVSEGTLTLEAGAELRLRLLDSGSGHCITGAGTLNLDGLLRLSDSSVTDSEGLWHLVNVDTLDVTWGGSFGLAFLNDTEPFIDEGGGIYTRNEWRFNQATGNLTRGDQTLDGAIFSDRFEPDDSPPSGCL
ncbi:hypothetical protein G4Y73_05840 [Wenzhouxiangella sp. XN201]|uniref:hypothetical protein n=1 Tax=Wenzhouxiangella sp. XN201 TaxID=2710755 RepID=UPI0013C55A07|nr:hypothetical protein [Wenzhouxiangella sp. XN201]NEZ03675.1 hypothetical protein [Wenzhouxiangella sp. XN201]